MIAELDQHASQYGEYYISFDYDKSFLKKDLTVTDNYSEKGTWQTEEEATEALMKYLKA